MPWVGRWSGLRVFAITDVSQRIAEVNENRVWVSIQNVDVANAVFLNFGEDALADSTMRLASGDTLILDRNMPWPDVITAVCGAALTATLLVNEVSQITEDGRGE
jgi:hypothetical protein